MWRKDLRTGGRKDRPKGTLLLIPGFADSPLSWLPTIALLQNRFARRFDHLVLIEFPGYHGYLFGERSFASIDKMLEVLVPGLDEVSPTAIIGHSMGGGLAAHYAGIRGAQFEGKTSLKQILLVAPSGVFVDREYRARIEQRLLQIVENGIECLKDLSPSLLNAETRLSRILNELLRFASQEDIRQFVQSFRDEHCLDPLLPSVKARVDLIWGTKDTLIPPTVVPCWLSGLNGTQVRLSYLEGIGHAPQLEAPGKLSSTISTLIKGKATDLTRLTQANLASPDDPFSAEIFPLLR
jgi:pimeloyl-ACP methyl ester carboxylesterase